MNKVNNEVIITAIKAVENILLAIINSKKN